MSKTMKLIAALAPTIVLSAPALADDSLSTAQIAEVQKLIQANQDSTASRASLLSNSILAGIEDDGKVVLQSENGEYKMGIGAHVQFRYIFNNEHDRTAEDSVDDFMIRRAKIALKGTATKAFDYALVFAADRSSGDVSVEDAVIGWKGIEGLHLQAGLRKLPFAREELISSGSQVAIDRSLATEYFTTDRSEGIYATYQTGALKWISSLSDGGDLGSENEIDNDADTNDAPAITSRIELTLDGNAKKDLKDNLALKDASKSALMLGTAIHYERPNNNGTKDTVTMWTADATYKVANLSFTGAVFGAEVNGVNGNDDRRATGVTAGVDYRITNAIDLFTKYDIIDTDESGIKPLQAITIGANWHAAKRVKLTGDVVYIFAGDDPSGSYIGNPANAGELSSGIGLMGGKTNDNDQIALRLQCQIKF